MMSLREMVGWCEGERLKGVRLRLHSVEERMAPPASGSSIPKASAEDGLVRDTNVMNAESNLFVLGLFAMFALEGLADYPGPMTHELLVQSNMHNNEGATHAAKAAAAAPDAAMATAIRSQSYVIALFFPRRHISRLLPTLPDWLRT